jgi:hypothetical protein
MKVNMLVKKNDDTEAERGISGSNPRIAVSKNNSLDLVPIAPACEGFR